MDKNLFFALVFWFVLSYSYELRILQGFLDVAARLRLGETAQGSRAFWEIPGGSNDCGFWQCKRCWAMPALVYFIERPAGG
jgi:hypothetical protein